MSGHSKWSKVKHQKKTTDAVKGAAFTKASRAITIAVREGGGIADSALNFRLRLAIEKARQVNMPKENIDRAIAKGRGGNTDNLESIIYEAYGPGGVAILLEGVTDNRQRTAANVKSILNKFGGALAGPGAVSYLCSRLGIVTLARTTSFEEVFSTGLEAGASDIREMDDVYEIYTNVQDLLRVRVYLEKRGLTIDHTAVVFRANTHVRLPLEDVKQIQVLVDQLEALEDISVVYSNCTSI